MQRFYDFIADYNGKPLAGATVQVQNYPSLTSATYYLADSTATPLIAPLTSGADGNIWFYVPDGRYQLVITATNGRVTTLPDIVLNDPADDFTNMSTTYLQITSAADTYLSQSNAASTYLNISSASAAYLTKTSTANYLSVSTASSTAGASLIGFQQAGTGATVRTVQDKERERVTVKDFGAVCDGTADDRSSVQAAIDYVSGLGGGTVVINRNSVCKIASSHPTKTFLTPGDDGSVPTGYGTDTTAEVVSTMAVGLWLPTTVNLMFEDDTSYIIGTWAYSTASPIDTDQQIGILVSHKTSTNPKAADGAASIVTAKPGAFGNVRSFMINVVVEGILTSSKMQFASDQSAFPFIAQGADNCEFDIQTMFTKAGVIIGGQWLTRANTTVPTYLPVYPAGFGTPNTYPATDVHLIGWCDNCSFSSRMQRPDLGGAGGTAIDYDTWEIAIDEFFDTYFFKSASSSRLGTATPSPATLRSYIGVVGVGMQVMSRYGRIVSSPKFHDMKNYGLLRCPVYCEVAYTGTVDRMYCEGVGTLDGNAFGTVVNDPYRSAGYATASFVRGPGGRWGLYNIYAGGLVGKMVDDLSARAFTTQNCGLNGDSYGVYDALNYNNHKATNVLMPSYTWTAGSTPGICYGGVTASSHSFGSLAQDTIATVALSGLADGAAVCFKLRVLVIGLVNAPAYACTTIEFLIPVGRYTTTHATYTRAAPAALYEQRDGINTASTAITATCQASIASDVLSIKLTPANAVGTTFSTCVVSWQIETLGYGSLLVVPA